MSYETPLRLATTADMLREILARLRMTIEPSAQACFLASVIQQSFIEMSQEELDYSTVMRTGRAAPADIAAAAAELAEVVKDIQP